MRFLNDPRANVTKFISIGSYSPEVRAFGTLITPHAQRERGKVIDRGVHIYTVHPV